MSIGLIHHCGVTANPEDIVLYGTGGNSRDILEALEAVNQEQQRWNILGFLDDDRRLFVISSARQRQSLKTNHALRNTKIVLAIGNDSDIIRRKTIRQALGLGANRFPIIVHPRATISRQSHIGEGTIFLSGSFWSNCTDIGRHVVVLQNTVISQRHTALCCVSGEWVCCCAAAVTKPGS